MADDDAEGGPIAVAIESLIVDPHKYQTRAKFREDVAEKEYTRVFDELDPPKVARLPDGRKIVYDGFHTIHAAKTLGKQRIAVEMTEVEDEAGAFKLALGANPAHGIQRTDEDKRRAVLMALAHPATADWTNRSIAQAARVADTFVGDVRAECEKQQARSGANGKAKKPAARQKRVGKDGRLYKAKKGKKPGRALFNVAKIDTHWNTLVRLVDDLYRAYGKANERGTVQQDAAYEGMKACLKGFREGFRERYKQLTRERPPEE